MLRTPRGFCVLLLSLAVGAQTTPVPASGSGEVTIAGQQLSRPARPWEFLDAVGQRAGLFGNEGGRFEAWVYPIKLLRDFDLAFVLHDRRIPASSTVRQLTMRPEGPTLTLATDSFTVRESWLVPPEENGAIVRLEVDAWEPLQVQAEFTRDFQLMWPAGLGGTYMSWNPERHAFEFGEEGRKFAAMVGSPSCVNAQPEFFSNSYGTVRSSFSLKEVPKGKSVQYIFLAGASNGPDAARDEYARLAANPQQYFSAAAKYYADYLARTLSIEIPDPKLQAAYDWSRISTIQGMVTNPYLGTGLVAGYRTSADSARPGFAWFFGRDSLWTDLALDSIGDFSSTRTALDFIAKYQRKDGKIEHEISQTATLVDWWTGFPYAYAAADATPLFIIALNDYVSSSGDVEFGRQHWDNALRAYQFLKSTYDANDLPRNFGVGHGWIEGGPLLPVESESYQSGLGAASLQALASLARLTGNSVADIDQQYKAQRDKINRTFWSADQRTVGFAIDRQNQLIPTTTVLTTAPMWFDAYAEDKANATIDQLAGWEHSADWGMRIISEKHPLFGPTGYHFGSVWPLFTGWASVAEYRNHRPLEAFANLSANSLLALDGSLGRVTEVLSGSFYEGLGTASPHQIWSSAMVLSPMIRGLFGISIDESKKTVRIAPHVPADWDSFRLHNLSACGGHYDVSFRRTAHALNFEVTGSGSGCTFQFSPAVSLHAQVRGTTANSAVSPQRTAYDQHPTVTITGTGSASVAVENDFGIVIDEGLPPLGSPSENLKISSEEWSSDARQLTLRTAGMSGHAYVLRAYGAKIASIDGGELRNVAGAQQIVVSFPKQDDTTYTQKSLRISF